MTFRTTFRDTLSSRQIALIDLPCTKNARRILAIVSTISIPISAPMIMEASVDPQPRGPDWMPITPKTGSLFHAETQSAACVSRPRSDEARAAGDRAAQARGDQAEGGARHPKKSRGLLREGIDVKFGFITKHRGIWPAEWLCEALGVSRGGFYAWLTRARSQRSRNDEELGAKIRASFLASDRTYGARRVWHDLLAEGISCGLHRIERLMRLQALKARPRRRRLRPIWVSDRSPPSLPTCSTAPSKRPLPIANGSLTSRMSGRQRAGSMWLPSSICSRGASLAGQ